MGEVSGDDTEKERGQGYCRKQEGSSLDGGNVTNGTKVILGIEYSGGLLDGKREGFGTQKWPNGCRYEGCFHNDTRHGKGKHWWPNGEVYEGEYCNDRRHGYGTYRWPGGAVFTGYFRNDKKDGKGTFQSEHGETFEGTYRNGERSGEGVLTYPACRQDVGVWCGDRLVQLRFTVHEAMAPLHAGSRVLHTPDNANRGDYLPKGPLETASQDLILSACAGDLLHLKALTASGVVHIDVVDRLGHSALLAAALHGQVEVVQFLLNEGADVNRLALATHYSPLSACCHLLYHLRVGHTKYHLHSLNEGAQRAETSSTSEYTILTEDLYSRTPSVLTPLSRAAGRSPQVGGACGGVSLSSESQRRSRSLSCSSVTDKGVQLEGLAQELRRAGVGKVERRSRGLSVGGVPSTLECWARPESTDMVPHCAATPSSQLTHKLPALPAIPQSRGVLLGAISATQPSSVPLSPQVAKYSACSNGHGDTRPQTVESHCTRSTTHPLFHQSTNSSVLMPTCHSDPRLSSTSDWESKGQHKESSVSRALGDVPLELVLGGNARTVTTPNSSLCTPTVPRWMKQATRLNSSKVFSTNHFGAILSAAQSTDILCREEDSEGEEEEEEEEGEVEGIRGHYLAPVSAASSNKFQDNRNLRLEAVIDTLLSRGADPNITSQPLPPLHYAVLAKDIVGVRKLTQKGACLETCLPGDRGGYSPLHLAVALGSARDIPIVEHLLEFGADPNLPTNPHEDVHAMTTPTVVDCQDSRHGGWTALHIACSCGVEADRATAAKTVSLLLKYRANPNLITRDHSPLSLAIMHGLNEVVDLLLENGADVSLPLGPGVGTALCAVVTHEALQKFRHDTAIAMVTRLLSHSADLFQAVPLFRDRPGCGTVVDHAHQQLNRGRCLRDFPPNSYHVTSAKSGTTKMAALQLLTCHLVMMMREELQESLYHQIGQRRTCQLQTLRRQACNRPLGSAAHGRSSRRAGSSIASSNSVPIPVPQLNWELKAPPSLQKCPIPSTNTTSKGQPFLCKDTDNASSRRTGREAVTKDLSNFCYECGRHSGVHLAPCPVCKVVHYCSKKCQKHSWNKEHCLQCRFLKQSGSSTTKTSETQQLTCDSMPATLCSECRGQPSVSVTVEGLTTVNAVCVGSVGLELVCCTQGVNCLHSKTFLHSILHADRYHCHGGFPETPAGSWREVSCTHVHSITENTVKADSSSPTGGGSHLVTQHECQLTFEGMSQYRPLPNPFRHIHFHIFHQYN